MYIKRPGSWKKSDTFIKLLWSDLPTNESRSSVCISSPTDYVTAQFWSFYLDPKRNQHNCCVTKLSIYLTKSDFIVTPIDKMHGVILTPKSKFCIITSLWTKRMNRSFGVPDRLWISSTHVQNENPMHVSNKDHTRKHLRKEITNRKIPEHNTLSLRVGQQA